MSLGYNPQIKAGKLYLETMDYFVPIKNGAPALQLAYQRLELGKKPVTKAQTEALASIRAQWRRRRDSNPRPPCDDACFQDKCTRPPMRPLPKNNLQSSFANFLGGHCPRSVAKAMARQRPKSATADEGGVYLKISEQISLTGSAGGIPPELPFRPPRLACPTETEK